QSQQEAGSGRISIVATSRLLADKRRPLMVVGLGQELRGRREAAAIDEYQDLAAKRRLARLLDSPVGMGDHAVLAIGLALDTIGREGFLLVGIFLETEFQGIDYQVVIILERLVDEVRE